MTDAVELACSGCKWSSVCGPTDMIKWLTRANMMRRDARPDPELLGELLRVAAGKLSCPQCGAAALEVRAIDDGDDEAWGMARVCEGCSRFIARERIEIFPNTRLCVECQARDDRGEASGPAEYCPKCGNVMTVRQSRAAGVTRYVQACPKCRSKG